MRVSVGRAAARARAERDQRRREIADRRAVGDVAADRARRAHLERAEAAHRSRRDPDRWQRDRAARSAWVAPAPIVKRCSLSIDLIESCDAAEPDDLSIGAQALGDPEADIGRAGDERRVGMRGIEIAPASPRSPAPRRSGPSSPTKTSSSLICSRSRRRPAVADRLAPRKGVGRGSAAQASSAASTIGR